MKMLMPASLLLALAACGQPAPQQPAPTPSPSPTDKTDYLARIEALAPKQRDVVFYRALEDAGSDCQAVSASTRRAPIEGRPAWTAQCEDGRVWVVILHDNGMMQVATDGPNKAAAR